MYAIFADNIFKLLLLNENFDILFQVSLQIVHKTSTKQVHAMACHLFSTNPLPDPMRIYCQWEP